jgi:PKD repeat protein
MKKIAVPKNCLVGAILCCAIIFSSCSKDPDPSVAPGAAFTYTSKASFPVIATFTNTSTSVGIVTQWQWNFGDGSTSATQNPIHAYTTSGTYNVRLIQVTSTGFADTVLRAITIPSDLTGPAGSSSRIHNIQSADFTFTLAYSFPYNLTFINNSTDAVTYLWDFGDGSTSTSNASPLIHVYPMPGTYHIVLTATNAAGTGTCGATISF